MHICVFLGGTEYSVSLILIRSVSVSTEPPATSISYEIHKSYCYWLLAIKKCEVISVFPLSSSQASSWTLMVLLCYKDGFRGGILSDFWQRSDVSSLPASQLCFLLLFVCFCLCVWREDQKQQLCVLMCISMNLVLLSVWWKKPTLPGCINLTLPPNSLPAWPLPPIPHKPDLTRVRGKPSLMDICSKAVIATS